MICGSRSGRRLGKCGGHRSPIEVDTEANGHRRQPRDRAMAALLGRASAPPALVDDDHVAKHSDPAFLRRRARRCAAGRCEWPGASAPVNEWPSRWCGPCRSAAIAPVEGPGRIPRSATRDTVGPRMAQRAAAAAHHDQRTGSGRWSEGGHATSGPTTMEAPGALRRTGVSGR